MVTKKKSQKKKPAKKFEVGLDTYSDDLPATVGLVHHVRDELKHEILAVREDLSGKIEGLRGEMRGEIGSLRGELEGLRADVKRGLILAEEQRNENRVTLDAIKSFIEKNKNHEERIHRLEVKTGLSS